MSEDRWIVLKRRRVQGRWMDWRQAAGRNFPTRQEARAWITHQLTRRPEYRIERPEFRIQRVRETDGDDGETVSVPDCSAA